jgi:MFS family permease
MTWLTGHAKTFEQLLAARALMGISEAAYLPAALALISDYHRGTTRSLATGVHLTGVGVGAGLAGSGGWMAERYGWSFAFDFFGLFGIAYAMVLMFFLRDAPPTASPAATEAEAPPKVGMIEALRSLFGSGSFILILIYWGLFAVAGWAFVGWMPTYLGERFSLGQGVAGFSATSYYVAATLTGLLIGGVWADRWGRTNRYACILVPTIAMSVGACAVFTTTTAGTLIMAIVGLAIFGLARGTSDANTMPMLCLAVDPRYRATGFGVLNLLANSVGGIAVYVGGALRDAHVSVTVLFQFGTVCTALCAAVLWFLRRRPLAVIAAQEVAP